MAAFRYSVPRASILMIAVGLCVGCATVSPSARHPTFTADRVLGLKVGLSTDSIITLFGRPDRTRAMTCGTQTPSPWQCLVWEYDMGSDPRGRFQTLGNTNRLTFSAELTPPSLNNWTIDLMYDAPPK